ncbi:nicotinate-nucleotide pyrophosphorylase [Aspergillus rambellii]|uniref:Nicotinate-nucleotide pyrophosphorylase [carboxylating] n=1 Tax=Aspergillus rambellii TaxID=308745 RepID=A0A0F8XDP3_9EURO|nr:nicotinate-nucleotide pyrophosphorylase [Aspergillus rambellii]
MASTHGDLRHLLPGNYKRLVSEWLEEDCPSFDYGGFVVGESEGEARLLGKSSGIIAGVPFFDEVFSQLGCTYSPMAPRRRPPPPRRRKNPLRNGARPHPQDPPGRARGLNILARCSGIATKSAALVEILRRQGWHGTLAGTRKTTPGFRIVEKYGMLVGGADPHRHDLSSMTMLKDNHVWACANNARNSAAAAAVTAAGEMSIENIAAAIPRAVAAAKAVGGFATKVEVECRSLEEARAAIGAGADVIMLDNFTADGVREAARTLKEEWKGKGRLFLIEVSGGLNEENAAQHVCPDVDILSTSSIHQSAGIVDFSLKVSLR